MNIWPARIWLAVSQRRRRQAQEEEAWWFAPSVCVMDDTAITREGVSRFNAGKSSRVSTTWPT